MFVTIWNLFFFIIAMGILVSVHEFGHFWVARRCGVKIEKFSIGFGKSLWSKKGKDGVEYSISMIPLGGFVKMLDSRVGDVPDDQKHLAFNHKKLWQRSAIVAAGPVFNFLLAIIAYWLVFLIGVPSIKPVIGEVTPNSIAEQAGMTPNMMITQVGGVDTPEWESAHMALVSHIGDKQIQLTVSSLQEIGTTRSLTLDTTNWQFDPDKDSALATLGFTPYRPEVLLELSQVTSNSAAEVAGLEVGDKLKRVNGEMIPDWQWLVDKIKQNPNQALELSIERSGADMTLIMTPSSQEIDGVEMGFAGIAPTVEEWLEGYTFDYSYGVFSAIPKAIEKTGQMIKLTGTMIKKLITGDVGLNNLSGPITIAKGAGTTADYGLVYFLGFLGLISINLGIINLLPLPVLDGGHLLFFAIEAVIRRPVPEKVQEFGYRIGSIMVLSLMLFAIYNDVARL